MSFSFLHILYQPLLWTIFTGSLYNNQCLLRVKIGKFAFQDNKDISFQYKYWVSLRAAFFIRVGVYKIRGAHGSSTVCVALA